MSLIEELQAIGQDITREVHGEDVTLFDAAGDISVEIADAVVTIDVPTATRDTGPVEYTGTLRLAATHHVAATAALTASVRGQTWDVITVGDVYAGTFRAEIGRLDEVHTNEFDLKQEQATWHE